MRVIRCSLNTCRRCVPERQAVKHGAFRYCSDECVINALIRDRLSKLDERRLQLTPLQGVLAR